MPRIEAAVVVRLYLRCAKPIPDAAQIHLTSELSGRATRPEKRRGRTLFPRPRRQTDAPALSEFIEHRKPSEAAHGPLQR